jgi:acetyl-CoA acetyltransferase
MFQERSVSAASTPVELRDRACIVGIGHTEYAKRGVFESVGSFELAVRAIRAACDDAGIDPRDIDGFTSFGGDESTPSEMQLALGSKNLRYASTPWGGGGSGLPTAVLNAVMAVACGVAENVAVVRSIVQGRRRLGGNVNRDEDEPPSRGFYYQAPFGFVVPMAIYALRTQRHMAKYGTTIDHLADVAIAARRYSAHNPDAVFRDMLTREQHHASRIVADPLRLFDCCMESDGAAAVIVTSAERASDMRAKPVYVRAVSTRSPNRWHPVNYTEEEELFASSGHAAAAEDVFRAAGIGPTEIDVAEIYDGSTSGLIMATEDWGFCARGEGGDYFSDGQSALGGSTPINTHGGNLAEVYLQGITHLVEGVRQLRGTAVNQVDGAEVALYSSGLGYPPLGGILLRS